MDARTSKDPGTQLEASGPNFRSLKRFIVWKVRVPSFIRSEPGLRRLLNWAEYLNTATEAECPQTRVGGGGKRAQQRGGQQSSASSP